MDVRTNYTTTVLLSVSYTTIYEHYNYVELLSIPVNQHTDLRMCDNNKASHLAMSEIKW